MNSWGNTLISSYYMAIMKDEYTILTRSTLEDLHRLDNGRHSQIPNKVSTQSNMTEVLENNISVLTDHIRIMTEAMNSSLSNITNTITSIDSRMNRLEEFVFDLDRRVNRADADLENVIQIIYGHECPFN